MLYVAFSGGKDSTALAYRLSELGEVFALLNTPTGNEPPDVERHIWETSTELGAPIVRPSAPSLGDLIERWNAL